MLIKQTKIPLYGIFIITSLLIGLIYQFIYLKKKKISNNDIILYMVMVIPFALIGGKMLTMITSKETSILTAGLSSYGGAFGVLLSGFIYEKINNKQGLILKSSIMVLPLIYGIAKIGCFFAGCCYGIPYSGPFNVTYINTSSVLPIQLIETITFIILFVIIQYLDKKTKNIELITITISAFLKFMLDFLRYSHIGKVLSLNQIISIVFIVIILLWYKRYKYDIR